MSISVSDQSTSESQTSQQKRKITSSKRIDISRRVNIVGSLLQTTTTVASISIALYATLQVLDLTFKEIQVPQAVFWGLGISGGLTLIAHILLLRELRILSEEPSEILYHITSFWAHSYWGGVSLVLVYAMIIIPGFPQLISSIFNWVSEAFRGQLH